MHIELNKILHTFTVYFSRFTFCCSYTFVLFSFSIRFVLCKFSSVNFPVAVEHVVTQVFCYLGRFPLIFIYYLFLLYVCLLCLSMCAFFFIPSFLLFVCNSFAIIDINHPYVLHAIGRDVGVASTSSVFICFLLASFPFLCYNSIVPITTFS